MESNPACRQTLTGHFRAEWTSELVAGSPQKHRLAVSRARRDAPNHGLTDPVWWQDGFSVVLQLREQPKRELFLGERCVQRGAYPARTITLVNHAEQPRANLISPFDTILFNVPRSVLDEIADDRGVRRVSTLCCEPCTFDETTWHFAQVLLPALDRPQEIGAMCADHLLMATHTYFAIAFGGMRMRATPKPGCLAPWQLQRATEIMLANLDADLALSVPAAQCGLSLSYFTRAFNRTTGDTPHRWLLSRRIEHSKRLLRESGSTLAEIAAASGFADQSHFTRVFRSKVGASPGAWRRSLGC